MLSFVWVSLAYALGLMQITMLLLMALIWQQNYGIKEVLKSGELCIFCLTLVVSIFIDCLIPKREEAESTFHGLFLWGFPIATIIGCLFCFLVLKGSQKISALGMDFLSGLTVLILTGSFMYAFHVKALVFGKQIASSGGKPNP